jgi:hypothetical protein
MISDRGAADQCEPVGLIPASRAARILKMTTRDVFHLSNLGVIPYVLVGGQRRYVRNVMKWINRKWTEEECAKR